MPKYSLVYFEDLFGGRNPGFWELIGALAEELDGYARELPQAVNQGPEAVARIRHDHRPAVVNLGLEDLCAREEALKRALEAGDVPPALVQGITDEAASVAQALTSERLRA